MKKLLAKIRKILHDRRTRRFLTRFVSGIAAIVVFITTYALVLPAITMEKEANCGIEAHQHDDSCYTEELICDIPESEGHHHDESCYRTKLNLICETAEHEHSVENGCYDDEGNLICERKEHRHGDECYEEVKELTCEIPESDGHQHSEECYEKILTCGREVHVHSISCYEEEPVSDTAVAASTNSAAAATTSAGSVSSAGMTLLFEDKADLAADNPAPVDNADTPDNDTVIDNDDIADNGGTGATASSTTADQYIPPLDAIDFSAVLNNHTGIYYHSVADGETVEDSSVIPAEEWNRIPNNTDHMDDMDDIELGTNDLLRVYLSYTIPAGSLNTTNPTARYRLPSNLHLTDPQVKAINENANGIAGQYIDMSTLEIKDPDKYNASLGLEAVEGTRRPDESVEDYLIDQAKKTGTDAADATEYISAIVRVENVYDTDGVYGDKGAYLGQDLIFTFTPYSIEKNQHEYDSDGQPTKAGEKIKGWLTLDLNMGQVDFDNNAVDKEDSLTEKSDGEAGNTQNQIVTIKHTKRTAEIVFVEEGMDEKDNKIDQISTSLTMAEETVANVQDGDALEDDEKVSEPADQIIMPAMSFNDSIKVSTGRPAGIDKDAEGTLAEAAESLPEEAKVSVRVEADEGTFPAGTTMVLSAVDQSSIDALAETLAETVEKEDSSDTDTSGSKADDEKEESDNTEDKEKNQKEGQKNSNTKTYGFQAVDITFLDKDGNEIEPAKPVRVALTSALVEQAREKVEDSAIAAPVVVHVDNDGNAEQMDLVSPEEVEPAKGRNEEELIEEAEQPVESDKAGNADEGADAAPDNSTDNKDTAAVEENGENAGTTEFTADSFSVYAIVYTVELYTNVITDSGETYRISVTYDETSGIPQDAELKVKEIKEGDKGYEDYYTEAVKAASESSSDSSDAHDDASNKEGKRVNPDKTYARFFDIEIWANGEKIEPTGDVSVSIRLLDLPETDDGNVIKIVHFDQDDIEIIPHTAAADHAESVDTTKEQNDEQAKNNAPGGMEFNFTASSFSVYSVVSYTVDFEYSVNGKMYQFSLPGGGFVSFTDLVEVLGIIGDTNSEENGDETGAVIAENAGEDGINERPEENGVNSDTNTPLTLGNVEVSDAAKKFVADVASVEFSSPELVDVSKVEADTTVGQIKDSRELECEYSAELTEEQIAEINAQTVKAGDFALISVSPFTSEETLTVTMKDGEVFAIRVTDAQIKKTVIDAKGDTWEITVTYGEDAQIPDGAELKVREILPEEEEYEQYYQQSLEKVGVVNTESEADATEEDSNTSAADVVKDTVEGITDLIVGDDNEDETEEPAKKAVSDYARIFDIEIWADNHKVEPAADVTVNIRLLDAPKEAEMTPQVVHFAKEGPELMELKEQAENSEDEGIRFVTDEFSVYSVVYTVDFSYEVNGKVYGFTMQGEDSVSLRALIEALHVYERPDAEEDNPAQTEASVSSEELTSDNTSAEKTDLDEFMKDIVSVEFSDPELLAVCKVEEDCNLGRLKFANGITQQFSYKETQDEVIRRNSVEYSAGDWALISLKPFDSKEELAISLKTGESFTITVTDAQDAVMNSDGVTVQTIANPAGTTIDLFDYWVDTGLRYNDGRSAWPGYYDGWNPNANNLGGTGNEAGINAGHALKFSPAWEHTVINGTNGTHNTNGANGLNSYTGGINPFTGIVQNTLADGYPKLSNDSAIGSNGESLAYLFNPNVSNDYKESYTGVNQLLYVDKNGYYTFDSRDYYARYNEASNEFTVTEQTTNDSKLCGFWPFNDQSSQTRNFWVGMHVNTQFSMPAGGQVLNPSGVLKPMQFEFSGDDDVWIYVDGILIGDAGGIHNRTEVDINFQTGIVSVTGQQDKFLDDLFRTGLREQGKTDSEIEEYITNNFDEHTFKTGTYHTFDFFYLERGGEESNLYIHYNLVSTADFTAHKSYYGEDETDILTRDQFQFELIGLEEDAIMPAGGSPNGEGTVASPRLVTEGGKKIYTTGVTEDGNVNFGSAVISEEQKANKPTYHYIVREVVPDEAVNANGTTWAEATDEEKNAGGFVLNQVEYDKTIYYMAATVTSWEETDASGQSFIRYGLSKKYYTDDTYTELKQDTDFISFLNQYKPVYGIVDFVKVNDAEEPLEGAEFTLYKDEACTIPATDLDTEGHPVWTTTSDSNGKVSFENVRVGTYYMKETTAPSQYALDETVYKVVIEDSKDNTKKSKITILGDEEEIAVTEIANAKTGKITVIKKWLNASGTEIDGGSSSATVWLKRKQMVAEESSIGSHIVTVTMKAENAGEHAGDPVVQTVSGDTIIIEWDDEWQGNFNWWLTIGNRSYAGWISEGNEDASGDGYIIHQLGEKRRLTITNVQDDEGISFTVKHWQTWIYSNEHWTNFTHPTITGSFTEPNYVAEEDTAFNNEKYTQVLSGSTWSHTWNIGGTESSHDGFDYPAMDANGRNYLYYVVELDAQGNAIEVGGSPLEGYVLQGYSANNNTGVSNQGVIMVYNRAEGAETINIVIKKTDNAENSTNYLDGAVFKLMYRSDSSGTYTNVSSESVPQLNSESKFTVPTDGITLTGLVDGQYQLQEISPPSGYVITNSTPVTFTVSGGAITSMAGTITGVRYTAASETSDAEFIIPNEPGAALPSTGGPGTTALYLLGIMLTAFAGAGLVMRKRRRDVA